MAKGIKYQFASSEIDLSAKKNPDIEQIFREAAIKCRMQWQFDANYPIVEKETGGEITVEGEFGEETAVPTVQEDTDAMLIVHEYRLTFWNWVLRYKEAKGCC